MKPTFFAPSISLPHVAILTGRDSVEIVFADGQELSYNDNGGVFAEVESDFLNYEKLVAALSNEDCGEDEITAIMEESLDAADKYYLHS